MCGIFGLMTSARSRFSSGLLRSTANELFKLSESRGKEASGLAVLSGSSINVYKSSLRASIMVSTKEYRQLLNPSISEPVTIIGHSRLVTCGIQQVNSNNQPVIKDGIVGVHNGIIINCEKLWLQYPELKRQSEVDSEIIFSLIRLFYQEDTSLVESVRRTFSLIQGAASIAVLFSDIACVLLATNTGSLYICTNEKRDIYIFASEFHILRSLLRNRPLRAAIGEPEISHVKPGSGCLVNLADLNCVQFLFNDKKTEDFCPGGFQAPMVIRDFSSLSRQNKATVDMDRQTRINAQSYECLLPDDVISSINSLKRCTKCILPETMPFISFDDNGVCNYCRDYRRIIPRGKHLLDEIAQKYRSKTDAPDCIVGLSGGRDSTYGLHYIKTVLNMNPIAYTYDWGMVTDLARRNISRVCSKLGIEHILVSADIAAKRRYIRSNVTAWLNKPDLGIIPLFMAGDKQYFYYANKTKSQTQAKLIFLCENMLERTDFKTGFCGIAPEYVDDDHVYTLNISSKIKLFGYYALHYLLNRCYLNSSMIDTLWAYFCYYLMPRDYVNLYRYINWDEKEIISTLSGCYDWEFAKDTNSTWRIGDGTAAFYNYIYYTVAGFTENDTFRSNQIREGNISREQALELLEQENKPRYNSIIWYCDTIGIDFAKTIKTINSIPKRYKFIRIP